MGDGRKKFYESEASAGIKMGKKIVAARDLPEGTVISTDDLMLKSPGDGLPPYEIDKVIGRSLKVPVGRDGDLHMDMLSDPDESTSTPTAADTAAAGDRQDVRPH